MKNQFDHQIHSAFIEKLDSVHASEDLIALTLKNMQLQNTPNDQDKGGTLSAINTRYVRKHVVEEEKRARRRRIRLNALAIASCFVAASLTVIGVLVSINTYRQVQYNKLVKRTNSYTNTAYISTADAMQFSVMRTHSNIYPFYFNTSSSNTPTVEPLRENNFMGPNKLNDKFPPEDTPPYIENNGSETNIETNSIDAEPSLIFALIADS